MSAISLKSITGITSITTPAGVDNQLTLHTNNTVERLRITSDGNVGVNTSSVSIAGMSRYLSVSARNVTNGGAAVELVGARTGSDQTLGVINFVNQTSKVAEIRSKYQGSTTLGSLHFQTSGTERLQITSTGDLSLRSTTQNAFLGLTANSTAINLTLGSTAGENPRAYFYGTGNGQSTAGDIFMGTGVGGELRLRSGGAIKLQTNSDSSTIDAFYVHAAGTVAVNTLSPDTTYKLDVFGAGQFTTSTTNQQNDFLTGQLTVRNNQSAQGAFIDFRADSATGVQGVIAKIGGFNVHSGSGYDGLLTFSTRQNSNNTMVERMRIKHDGYVGISTNNPVNKLHVEGLNTVARFSSSSSYVDIKLQNSNNQLGFIQYNGTELRFFANSGSTPTVYIPNGKFGVNTVPSTTLHVKDAIPEIRLTSTDASLGQSEIVGKLSISTSDPTTPTGAGVVSYIETFSATSNGSDYTTSISNRAGAGGGETRIRLGNALGQIRFYTNTSGNGTERLRITSGGSLLVNKTSTSDYGKFEVKGGTADNIETADITAKTIATFSGSTPGTTAAGKGAGIVIKPIADRGCNYFIGVANDSANQEAHGRFIIRSGNFAGTTSERLRISSSGHITPGSDNSQHIGDGTTNFNSIWASTRFRGNDDVKLVLGNSQDLVVRHSGGINYIESPQGGSLHIKSGVSDNANLKHIQCDYNGNTIIYHQNGGSAGERIKTTNDGIEFGGEVNFTSGYNVRTFAGTVTLADGAHADLVQNNSGYLWGWFEFYCVSYHGSIGRARWIGNMSRYSNNENYPTINNSMGYTSLQRIATGSPSGQVNMVRIQRTGTYGNVQYNYYIRCYAANSTANWSGAGYATLKYDGN